jgi:hypothetical protein
LPCSQNSVSGDENDPGDLYNHNGSYLWLNPCGKFYNRWDEEGVYRYALTKVVKIPSHLNWPRIFLKIGKNPYVFDI